MLHTGARVILALLAVQLAHGTARSAPAAITVYPDRALNAVSPHLYGHFLEHIYSSVVGGLDGQRLLGPGFEEPARWRDDLWSVVQGDWVVHDDGFSGSGTDTHIIAQRPALADHAYVVEARKELGAEGFLIIFRAVDADNFYWWNLGGWGNQRSAVECEQDGMRRVLAETETDTTIEQDRWYTIAIEVTGDAVVCRLDGEVLATFTDPTHRGGGVGLGVWATSAQYRNPRILHPDGRVEVLAIDPETVAGVSAHWRATDPDLPGVRCALTQQTPRESRRAQRITSDGPSGGVAQSGLSIAAGERYEGSVWLRGAGDVAVALEADAWRDEVRFSVSSDDWREFPFAFDPAASTADGAFSIRLAGPGDVVVDCCALTPADTPYRDAVYTHVEAVAPTFIRWPGGCYAEWYRWKDGIGSRPERVTKPNIVWGGLDPNHFGTAEFVRLCRDIGADPVIVLNIGHHDAPERLDEYIQEALDWVEYCNGDVSTPYGRLRAEHGHPEPFNVVYWEIGNETWPMGVEAYAERARIFVDALRARHDNLRYLLCGSGGHNLDWNRRILESAATHMDYLSTHHYMAGSFDDEMRDGVAYPDFLKQTADLVAKSANPAIRIACTEWNQQSIALRTGLYAGMLLNGFERHGDVITMSCPALFIRKTDAIEWNNAFINHDGHRAFVAPNYLVMKLYRDHFAPTRVACDAPRTLNVVATRDPQTGDVIVKVVNPSETDDVAADLRIAGAAPERVRMWRIHAPSIDDVNSLDEPERVRVVASESGPAITFPAHSVTVLRTHP